MASLSGFSSLSTTLVLAQPSATVGAAACWASSLGGAELSPAAPARAAASGPPAAAAAALSPPAPAPAGGAGTRSVPHLCSSHTVPVLPEPSCSFRWPNSLATTSAGMLSACRSKGWLFSLAPKPGAAEWSSEEAGKAHRRELFLDAHSWVAELRLQHHHVRQSCQAGAGPWAGSPSFARVANSCRTERWQEEATEI